MSLPVATLPDTETMFSDVLGRQVTLRRAGSDSRTFFETHQGLYHVPPLDYVKKVVPRTVLDLGANIGLASAHYRRMWPAATIVGVEMDGESLRLARWNEPTCLFVHAAVSSRSGWGWYRRKGAQDSYRLDNSARGKDGKRVLVRSLSSLIAEFFRTPTGAQVDFVKMDVEGEEWELFEHIGEWAPWVGALLVELHVTVEHPRWDELDSLCVEALADHFDVYPHPRHPHGRFATR